MKAFFIIGGIAILALIGWVVFSQSNNPDILARSGLHWHAHLTIEARGANVVIPEGIGLTGEEMPIHTHATDGIIHMEFPGVVTKEDVMLGQFFKVWGKNMRTAFGTLSSMTVNGATSTAYENYVMHDGDSIVLSYE